MQKKSTTSPPSEAEKFLKDEHYSFQKRPDGVLVVQDSIDIAQRNLGKLPDLSNVIVRGNFYCQGNNLTSLKGAPREVNGGFWCYDNQLESLEYSPAGVTGQYICHDNKLTSLAHAPKEITGDFSCVRNPLTHLEGAPKKFHKLTSDFGDYATWDAVPEYARFSPETRARQLDAAARDATVLRGEMKVSKPLAFRKPSVQGPRK